MTKATVDSTLEHLFRRESGKIVCDAGAVAWVSPFRSRRNGSADALLKAVQYGRTRESENAAGWIFQTAKNRALDLIKKRQRLDRDFMVGMRSRILKNARRRFWKANLRTIFLK